MSDNEAAKQAVINLYADMMNRRAFDQMLNDTPDSELKKILAAWMTIIRKEMKSLRR